MMPSSRARSVIGLVLACFLLLWALHDVDFAQVLARVRGVRALPLLAAITLITFAHFPIRVIRWRHLLRPEGATLPFWPLFHATAIGTLMNYILPARLGEVGRAYAARELTTSSFSTAIGSLLTERVVDGIATCVMLFAAIAIGGYQNQIAVGTWTIGRVAAVASVAFGLALLVLLGSVFWPKSVKLVRGRLLLAEGRETRVAKARAMIRGVVAGFDSLRSVERSVAVAVWTALLWIVSACGIWLGLHAFGLAVPLPLALTLQALISLAIALPSSPGFVGPFEAAARAALSLGAIDSTQALGFSLPFHVVALFLPVTVIGVWSLSRTGMQLTRLETRAATAAGEGMQRSK